MTGKELNAKWGVGARQALYSKTGSFYNVLTKFPAALFDPHGYVKFNTREEYEACPLLRIGDKLNVPDQIDKIPGYVEMD